MDRWCVIAVFNDAEWQRFCQVMGNPAWTSDERFSTPSRRKEHAGELDELLGQWTVRHPPEEVVDLLQGAGVPAGVVQNAEDLAHDPHLRAREFFVSLEHPILGETISDSSPIRFTEGSTGDWKAAPSLGEDNRYVYTELLGFTESEVSSYVEKGIIG
jgi:crotonobetainyl-CoA:carnitine CoA-transferase CaiB-like acyl-CoA transferase